MLKSKTTRYAAISVLAIALFAYMMIRQDAVKNQAERLMQSNKEIVAMGEKNIALEADNYRLVDENVALMIENGLLRDTIAVLRTELDHLTTLFDNQKTRIEKYEQQLTAAKIKLQKVQAEIQRIKGSDDKAMAQRQEKIEEIKVIQEQTVQIEEQRERTYTEMGKTETTLVTKELEELRMKQIDFIRNHTTVNYKLVECRQTRAGKPISQLEEDGTNWVLTTITFDLQNSEPGRLIDETFRVKLVDTDTGMELPYLESNPAFSKAKNESKGFTFNYRENPVRTMYINLQAKAGKNYSTRLYYVNDEQEYLVAGSEINVIKNGKVVGM
jgi:hypothetical protein